VKDSFHEELEHVIENFLKYVNILLGDFSAKLGKEDIFKSTIWNESLHKINHGTGIRVASFSMYKKSHDQRYDPTLEHPEIYLGISRWENSQSDLPYSDK
jgi:hypothetical protein